MKDEKASFIGVRCGKLTTVEYLGDDVYRCVCSCGGTIDAKKRPLYRGHVKSCGCLRRKHVELAGTSTVKKTSEQRRAMYVERATTHGQGSKSTITRAYRAWIRMKQKCFNEKHSEYGSYGGKGITVCMRWRISFEDFYADMGPAPEEPRTGLLRHDKDGDYCPENCYWGGY